MRTRYPARTLQKWDIVKKIEELQLLKGWTNAELAHRASLSPTLLWKILHGERKFIDHEMIRRLADAFHVSTDILLGMRTEDRVYEAGADDESEYAGAAEELVGR